MPGELNCIEELNGGAILRSHREGLRSLTKHPDTLPIVSVELHSTYLGQGSRDFCWTEVKVPQRTYVLQGAARSVKESLTNMRTWVHQHASYWLVASEHEEAEILCLNRLWRGVYDTIYLNKFFRAFTVRMRCFSALSFCLHKLYFVLIWP